MADDKAGKRVIDAGNGILGSLRDALKAAGRGDAAADDPTDRKSRAPLAIASIAVEASPPMHVEAGRRPAPSAAEAVREAKAPLPQPALKRETTGGTSTRLVRPAAPALPPVPSRTRLVRGRAPVERGEFHQDPVVGWLVVVGGPGLGAFRPVFEGNNTMGRGKSNRVAIDFGDDTISTDEQAYIRYDSVDRAFLFVPNLAKTNVVSVNDRKPTGAVTLTAMDVITMGRTQLAFVPFCGADFDWSEIADAKS